jgi:type II secretory pathway pseudopilin PulG
MSVPPTPLATCRPARTEAGFGLVEVVIAVLLMMTIASGVVLAMSSSVQLRGAAKLQVSLTHTGQRMIEQLASDRQWMDRTGGLPGERVGQGCNPPRCAIAGEFTAAETRKLEDVDGFVDVIGPRAGNPPATESHAVPVDSPVDGIGAADEDGVIPDYYEIQLVIRPQADVVARYPGTAQSLTRRFTTAIDRNGNILKGSLRVDACVVRNQVDERMSIDGCNQTGTTNVKMDNCPLSPPASLASFYQGCTSAWNWVASVPATGALESPSPFVKLQRVDPRALTFQLRHVNTGKVTPSSQARIVNGTYVFENLDSGSYHIRGLPGAINVGGISHPRWRTKEIPTWHDDPRNLDGSVGVQPGVKNHALVLFRPPRTGRGIEVNFNRDTDVRRLDRHVFAVEKSPGPFPWTDDQWAPTDQYDGENATAYCVDHLSYEAGNWITDPNGSSASFETDDGGNGSGREYFLLDFEGGLKQNRMRHSCYISDHPDQHCKELRAYKSWNAYVRESTDENWSLDDYYYRYSFIDFCTFYRDELTHTHWRPGQAQTVNRPGAYRSASYEISPRPTPREIIYGGADRMSLTGSTTARNHCRVKGHTSLPAGQAYSPATETASRQCTSDSTLGNLYPGLNTSVFAPADTVITNSSVDHQSTSGYGVALTNPAQAPLNTNIRTFPTWMTGAGIWVRPNGGIVGGDGTYQGINPSVTVTGRGECYWTGGPTGTTAQYEGACDPCSPYWIPDHVRLNAACTNLTQSCVARQVVELSQVTRSYFKRKGGDAIIDANVRGWKEEDRKNTVPNPRCIDYAPAWPCARATPSIFDDNCAPRPAGGGGTPNVAVTNTRVRGGNARVGSIPINHKRGGR